MKERALALGPERSMLGIITRPEVFSAASTSGRTGVLLMNAGLVHRVGPNRLNVNLARRLAEGGYTSMRVDLSGLGDSAPRRDGRSLEESHLADLSEALDAFAQQEKLDRFVLVGVCSGADLSLSMAARDKRVAGAVMIDSFAYATLLHDAVGYGQRVTDRESWRNLLAGKSDLAERIRRRLPVGGPKGSTGEPEEGPETMPPTWVMPPKDSILSELATAVERGSELYFVYSGGPALYNYLWNFAGRFLLFHKSGRLSIKVFREADHTFTMSLHQEELLTAIERWMRAKVPA